MGSGMGYNNLAKLGRLTVQLLANRLGYPDSRPVTAMIHPRLVRRDSVQRINIGAETSAHKEEMIP